VSGVRYVERDGVVWVPVKVVPGASRSRVVGPLGDRASGARWKVTVAAPPEKGAANREACSVLASALGLRASAVTLAAGASSASKTFAVRGLDAAAVDRGLRGAS
jgi:uncharacterized protein YggU (UPF0235/DUF167 family)